MTQGSGEGMLDKRRKRKRQRSQNWGVRWRKRRAEHPKNNTEMQPPRGSTEEVFVSTNRVLSQNPCNNRKTGITIPMLSEANRILRDQRTGQNHPISHTCSLFGSKASFPPIPTSRFHPELTLQGTRLSHQTRG